MIANPFRPAEQVAPKVKCLIYGPPGIGKTYLALTSPGPIAVIDTEGGTSFYADRAGHRGLSRFDVLPTKTFAQVEQAVAYLREHPDEYATLVIDPVTVLYETLQDAAQMRRQETNRRKGKGSDEDADLEMLDWQRIKRAYKRLMTDLVNLPMHVVVTARENERTEERGRDRVHVGWKPDAEKSTPYYFDTMVRLVPAGNGREAVTEKDRTGTLAARVTAPTFSKLFGKALKSDATGDRSVQSDEEAARIDATSTMVAAELEERDEILTERGEQTHVGAVARGDGIRSNLEARMTPDGWMFGFRLALDAKTALAQVVAEGPVGKALYEHLGYDTERLYGQKVTVTGRVVKVERPGRSPFFRMYLSRIEGDGWVIPPDPGTAVAGEVTEPDAPPEASASLGLVADDDMDAVMAAVPETAA